MPNVRTGLNLISLVDFLFVDTEKNIGFWNLDALM